MRIVRALVVVAMVTLGMPAGAQAAETISVEGDAIRYTGDEGANSFHLGQAGPGEWEFTTEATPGPGCRTSDFSGRVACTVTGVTRIVLAFGDGPDNFEAFGRTDFPLRVELDLGPGHDHFVGGSYGADDIRLGEGNDWGGDSLGDDRIDGGPGNDGIGGGAASSGDDTIIGGAGNDSLSGVEGNDRLEGGGGDDWIYPDIGDDVMDGGEGNDTIGGQPASGPTLCHPASGTDTLLGGSGNDQICATDNVAVIDAGDGDDAISTLDAAPDGPIACGAGADSLWSDAVDAVGIDCEFQSQPELVLVPSGSPDVLPVRMPCAPGACAGIVTAFPTPDVPAPAPGALPPLRPAKPSAKPLARQRFQLRRRARRTVRLHLRKRAARRLRKLGETRVEARVVFTQKGRRYVVRRSFAVGPRKR
jgi:hypothetical protein